MVRFHVSPSDGVARRCNAGSGPNARGCRYGLGEQEHYATKAEASQAAEEYNKKVNGGTFNKKVLKSEKVYAPYRPVVEPVDFSYASNILERLRKNSGGRNELLNSELVGFGLTGSAVYGLNNEFSDRDVLLLTDSTVSKDVHKIFKDSDVDVKVSSVSSFANRLLDSVPQDIDLFYSGSFTLNNDFSRYDFLSSIRFNRLKYVDRCYSHMRLDLSRCMSRGVLKGFTDDSLKELYKTARTSLRNCVMVERLFKNGSLAGNVGFSDVERESFYRELELNVKPAVDSFVNDKATFVEYSKFDMLKKNFGKDDPVFVDGKAGLVNFESKVFENIIGCARNIVE